MIPLSVVGSVLHALCLGASVAVLATLVVGAVVLAGHLLEDVDVLEPLRCVRCSGAVVAGRCPCGGSLG